MLAFGIPSRVIWFNVFALSQTRIRSFSRALASATIRIQSVVNDVLDS